MRSFSPTKPSLIDDIRVGVAVSVCCGMNYFIHFGSGPEPTTNTLFGLVGRFKLDHTTCAFLALLSPLAAVACTSCGQYIKTGWKYHLSGLNNASNMAKIYVDKILVRWRLAIGEIFSVSFESLTLNTVPRHSPLEWDYEFIFVSLSLEVWGTYLTDARVWVEAKNIDDCWSRMRFLHVDTFILWWIHRGGPDLGAGNGLRVHRKSTFCISVITIGHSNGMHSA